MRITKMLLLAFLIFAFYISSQALAQKEDAKADRGKKLFMSYCASCHGADARGNGPVAASLKKQPSDLTKIQKGAKFPTDDVRKKISGDLSVPVHGKQDMPVWGLVFSQNDINNLVKYLESIQRPYEPQPAG